MEIFYYEAISSLDLSDIYIKEDKKNEARKFINNAKQIGEETGWTYITGKAFLSEGKLETENNNFTEAQNALKKSLSIGNELNEFSLIIDSNYKLAKLYERNNLNELAESHYNSAIKNIEAVSKPLFEQTEVQISYLSSNINIYDDFAEFYLKQKKYEKAFEMIDRSRSRNMMQNLNNLKLLSQLKEETLNKIYDYEWILHSGIYDKATVDSIKIVYSLLKKEIIKNHPSLKTFLNFNRQLNIKDLQNNLDDDDYYLTLYSTESSTHIFLITKEKFAHFLRPFGKQDLLNYLSNISPYYDQNIINNKTYFNQDLFSFNAQASANFFKEIFKNVFDMIPAGSNFIITPSTEMISFPFEFLITEFYPGESNYNYVNKKYLIEKYNISYIPSVANYIQQKNNKLKNNDNILIVGDPFINTGLDGFSERRGLLDESPGIPRNFSLLPLKYSEEEVNVIGSIVNADKVFLQNEATETNFKEFAEYNKIIHLSTHSFLYKNQPLIFFSNFYDAENDGFLEASEIVRMKLNSDLVVLSSCNSGLGTVDKAEGIIGMTKAFFEAGAKSIIVSLWDVNDKFTSKLMTNFYTHLSEGLTKSEALRQAKIDFIKSESPNPYYWAGFVLSGNTAKINLKQAYNIFPIATSLFLIILFAIILYFYLEKKPARY